MLAGKTLAMFAGLVMNGATLASDVVKAHAGADKPPAADAVWVGSVEFVNETTENHVENGDLGPDAGAGTSQAGTYSNTMRRLANEQATITAAECASGSGCRAHVAGAFHSSERSDAKQESRWLRNCPGGGPDARSTRTALTLTQSFRQRRGPAPAQMTVLWDSEGKTWVVDARLTPGAGPLPVCDDLTSEVESVDPGCGEPAPPPTAQRPAPSSAACASPALGGLFTVSAPADTERLTGSKTLEQSVKPDQPPSGAVRQKIGSVRTEKRIFYDLRRVGGSEPD